MFLVLSMWALISGPVEGHNPPPARYGDFGAYWVAGRCLLEHRNWYDPEEVDALARREKIHQAFVTWNPPWTLLLLSPLALLPFEAAALLWASINASLATGVAILWGRRKGLSAFASTTLGITFVPVAVCIGFSQLSILVLASATAYWILSRAGRPFWAGFALLAATTKPHLVSLVWILMVFHGPPRFRAYSWIGLAVAMAATLVAMTFWRPESLLNYCDAVRDPTESAPTNYIAATAPAWVQWAVESAWNESSGSDVRLHWIAYVPLLIAAPVMARVALRRSSTDRLFETALVVSVLLLPYGWHYDQTLLLPAYLSLCAAVAVPASGMDMSLSCGGLAAFEAGSAAMLMLRTPEKFFFVWPVLFSVAWHSTPARESSQPAVEERS